MRKSPLIIGLTGGIGSGKSEVTRRFAKLGICIVDADEVAREVVLPGQAALSEIAQHFGEDILTANGELDRAKLRNIIFDSPDEKRWLENLLHPLINQIIRTRLAQAESAYAILASPLLLETQQHTLVDRVLIIDTSEALQLARASKRDNSNSEQIKAIMASQISRTERLARADDIVHNLGVIDELDAQVQQLHQQYLSLAQTHHPH
jgi:dephospho-CoA kinase